MCGRIVVRQSDEGCAWMLRAKSRVLVELSDQGGFATAVRPDDRNSSRGGPFDAIQKIFHRRGRWKEVGDRPWNKVARRKRIGRWDCGHTARVMVPR